MGPDILVREPKRYPWPENIPISKAYGAPNPNTNLFNVFTAFVRRYRKDYFWVYFHPISRTNRTNSISCQPDLVSRLEDIFRDELGANYTYEQRELLLQSEIVIVAICKKTNSIAGYCSGRHSQPSHHRFSYRVVFGCHEIIAKAHQRAKLGVFMAAQLIMYDQRISNLFSKIGIIVRSNNKYILRPMQQFGIVFRSDQMRDPRLEEHRKIVQFMHNQLFMLKDVPLSFDQPLEIDHYFEEPVRIEGLSGNQIIYILCQTTLFKSVVKLLFRRKRKKQDG